MTRPTRIIAGAGALWLLLATAQGAGAAEREHARGDRAARPAQDPAVEAPGPAGKELLGAAGRREAADVQTARVRPEQLPIAEKGERGEEPGMSTNILKGLYRNWVSTTPDAGNPDLRTRLYGCGPGKVFDHVKKLAGKRRGWKIVEADLDDGILKIEARTLIFRFVDDVTIRVHPAPGGGTLLDMESRSRVGVGDLGTNARRVSNFLKRIDEIVRKNGEM